MAFGAEPRLFLVLKPHTHHELYIKDTALILYISVLSVY